jgi:hypothetical protein
MNIIKSLFSQLFTFPGLGGLQANDYTQSVLSMPGPGLTLLLVGTAVILSFYRWRRLERRRQRVRANIATVLSSGNNALTAAQSFFK